MGKVLITDTILRDAHQSQAATRMRLEEMLPVADKLDKIGYYSLECWGGATFDSCMRFLNEDPWERLRALRKAMPNTKLQMLFRGQNILGYKHYADDVVDEFVKKSIENGIDIIRIFDALNDLRNLEQAVKSTKKYGGNCEIAISYTISPVHTEEYFLKLAKEIEQMGADAICIKDMANLLLPYEAYSLVKKLKATTKLPIHLHTHNTAGTGAMTILKAIEAGCDIVDTALSPMAEGTSQPATESLCATLKGTEYDPCLDMELMNECATHFRGVAARLEKDGWLVPSKVLRVDAEAPAGLVRIDGAQADAPAPGQPVKFTEEDKLSVLQTVLSKAQAQGLGPISEVDLTNTLELSFLYQDRIRIVLGTTNDLDYKMGVGNGDPRPDQRQPGRGRAGHSGRELPRGGRPWPRPLARGRAVRAPGVTDYIYFIFT